MIRRSNSHSLQILQQFFLLQETDLPCFTVNGQKMLNFDRDAGAVGLDSRGGLMGRICIARGAYFPAIILIYIYWLYGVKKSERHKAIRHYETRRAPYQLLRSP
jgi:hypothetical protein